MLRSSSYPHHPRRRGHAHESQLDAHACAQAGRFPEAITLTPLGPSILKSPLPEPPAGNVLFSAGKASQRWVPSPSCELLQTQERQTGLVFPEAKHILPVASPPPTSLLPCTALGALGAPHTAAKGHGVGAGAGGDGAGVRPGARVFTGRAVLTLQPGEVLGECWQRAVAGQPSENTESRRSPRSPRLSEA